MQIIAGFSVHLLQINKMRSGLLFFLVFLLGMEALQSQETWMYRLYLKDKGNPPFSLDNPEAFLSSKSLERRKRQGLPVDSFDLPLDPAYLNAITQTGAIVRSFSKWVKTAVVHLAGTEILPLLESLSFVDSLNCVWTGTLPEKTVCPTDIPVQPKNRQDHINSYGQGFTQIALNNGHRLHDAGFRGKGIDIAVLDAGFLNVDCIDYFDANRIREVKNFNHETNDILRESHEHGTRVLSCMLSDKSGEMTGTAPEADYYLFRTEVAGEEFPVEEDYWTAALEYADSLGVEIVTSSLGYTTFNNVTMDHTHAQLDGKTVPISRAANLAASRGILLFNSAGNEGANEWEKINFPADAEHILTVGSVDKDSIRSSFSSAGFTADGRVKPDLMAMGSDVTVIAKNNGLLKTRGTSFATPILAGLAACLWEALPDLNSFSMLELLRETADRFLSPNPFMGYGIADVYKAYAHQQTAIPPINNSHPADFGITVFGDHLYINLIEKNPYERCVLNIYSTLGNKLLTASNLEVAVDLSSFSKGIYIACLQMGEKPYIRKFIKK
jgi:hypothetical protein